MDFLDSLSTKIVELSWGSSKRFLKPSLHPLATTQKLSESNPLCLAFIHSLKYAQSDFTVIVEEILDTTGGFGALPGNVASREIASKKTPPTERLLCVGHFNFLLPSIDCWAL